MGTSLREPGRPPGPCIVGAGLAPALGGAGQSLGGLAPALGEL